jgi:hypothetical protein
VDGIGVCVIFKFASDGKDRDDDAGCGDKFADRNMRSGDCDAVCDKLVRVLDDDEAFGDILAERVRRSGDWEADIGCYAYTQIIVYMERILKSNELLMTHEILHKKNKQVEFE